MVSCADIPSVGEIFLVVQVTETHPDVVERAERPRRPSNGSMQIGSPGPDRGYDPVPPSPDLSPIIEQR